MRVSKNEFYDTSSSIFREIDRFLATNRDTVMKKIPATFLVASSRIIF